MQVKPFNRYSRGDRIRLPWVLGDAVLSLVVPVVIVLDSDGFAHALELREERV
jgi:hypothetical protein